MFQCLVVDKLIAQPVIGNQIKVNGQTVFRDKNKTNIMYTMPPSFQLKKSDDGSPSISLLKMRYTGTNASGDLGSKKFLNIFQFTITVDTSFHNQSKSLMKKIASLYPGTRIVQLPIQKFSSILVFAGSDSVRTIGNGMAENTQEESIVNNSYWSERTVSFRLSDTDAQLVESALMKNQAVMSFSYAYSSIFSDSLKDQLIITSTNPDLIKEIEDKLRNEVMKEDSALHVLMIKADAIPIKINTLNSAKHIQLIDINEKVPAKFPVLSVHCFDFSGQLRDDLYAKKIEIKATSVNGSSVEVTYTFKKSQPDQASKSIRFQYAVRFDKPYYYRLKEISEEGEVEISEWIERKTWTENINITSPPEKIVRRPQVDIED